MIPERPHAHKVTHGSPFDDDYSGPPIRPKWLRPETGGPNARAFYHARTAITDAMHAGDPTIAALILHETARQITAHDQFWTQQRPPMGRHHPALAHTRTAPRKAA